MFQVEDLQKNGACMQSSKKSSKTVDQFTAISDLQDNKEHVLFQTANRQLSSMTGLEWMLSNCKKLKCGRSVLPVKKIKKY